MFHCTIERLIAAGHLPLVHVEGAARVRVADLGAYVQAWMPTIKPPSHPPRANDNGPHARDSSRH